MTRRSYGARLNEKILLVHVGRGRVVVIVARGAVGVDWRRNSSVPRNFLDDIPNESGPLAKVALHARDTRLWLVGGDLLYIAMLVSKPLHQVSASPPNENSVARAAGAGVRRRLDGRRTWPALMPAMMPDLCLTSFGMVAVVVEGGMDSLRRDGLSLSGVGSPAN